MVLQSAVVFATVLSVAAAHGLMTQPRMRGALDFQRGGVVPRKIADDATIDYCSHCLNAGGTGAVGAAGPWTPYKPMDGNKRGGFGICGDPAGGDDHMKSGRFANPPSKPFVANYQPGGVANFEFDATTNHGGYLEFYLCDVGSNPGKDIQFQSFASDCVYLERVPNSSCESGNDKECGPIDKKFPGRWVLPCRNGGGDQGDQVLGGTNGKMAYRIPNKRIANGVVHMYWLTTNTCNTPDGFMQNYAYPKAWAGCSGDGGSIGGKPQHTTACGSGGFPEEFWNCADVTVGGPAVAGAGADSPAEDPEEPEEPPTAPGAGGADDTGDDDDEDDAAPKVEDQEIGADTDTTDVDDEKKPATPTTGAQDGSCVKNWRSCTPGTSSCCSSEYECDKFWGSSEMCIPKSAERGPSGAKTPSSGSANSPTKKPDADTEPADKTPPAGGSQGSQGGGMAGNGGKDRGMAGNGGRGRGRRNRNTRRRRRHYYLRSSGHENGWRWW